MAILRWLNAAPGSQIPARRLPPPMHSDRLLPDRFATPNTAASVAATAPRYSHFFVRLAGLSASGIVRASMEENLYAGFTESPRSRIRRIQTGTRASFGGDLTR